MKDGNEKCQSKEEIIPHHSCDAHKENANTIATITMTSVRNPAAAELQLPQNFFGNKDGPKQ